MVNAALSWDISPNDDSQHNVLIAATSCSMKVLAMQELKTWKALVLVLLRVPYSSCCLCILSTLHPSQNWLDQFHFMNPHLPSEVTYTGEEHVSELHKPHIPQDRASQLGGDLEELQTHDRAPKCGGSCFSSSIEYVSLWIRGKCIVFSDVCF